MATSGLVRRPAIAAASAIAALAAGGWGCGYSPRPENGKLVCGPGNSCPEGYQCLPDGPLSHCWDVNTPRTGDGGNLPPVDGGLPFSDAGVTPVDRPSQLDRRPDTGAVVDTGTTIVRDRYVGTWIFGAGSVELTDCGPAFTPLQRPLDNASLTIRAGDARAGGTADLTARDICELYLGLDSSGTFLLAANDGAGCVFEDMLPDGHFRSTYTAWEFSFFSADGRTGTLSLADYDVLYEELDAGGTVIGAVICRQTVTGAVLSKLASAAQ